MSIRLSWLLGQKHLALTLRVGTPEDTRPIKFVQPTELLDPSPWLSGDELVLTTGLGLNPDDADLYVRKLSEAGVAALGFGIGLSHSSVPVPLVRAAEKVGLPLLEVPYMTPFAAITRTVTARLAEQQYEAVQRASECQVRITRAALRGGAAAIVRELAVSTGACVAYAAERTEYVTFHPEGASALVAQIGLLRREGTRSVTVAEPGLSTTVQTMTNAGAVTGYLALQADRPMDAVETMLVGHAVSLIALELDKPRRLRSERNLLGRRALQLLLKGLLQHSSAMDLLSDAVGDQQQVRILSVRYPDPGAAVEAIDLELENLGRPCYALDDAGTLEVLLRGTDTPADVAALVQHLPRPRALRAGLSAPHRLGAATAAVEQSRRALARTDATHRLVEFDATSGTTLLGSPEVRSVLDSVAASTVSVLDAYDRTNGAHLAVSLRAYLEANGQWEAAAAALEIHRHTLRARVAKIEELLDIDLADARVRAELLLTLLAVT